MLELPTFHRKVRVSGVAAARKDFYLKTLANADRARIIALSISKRCATLSGAGRARSICEADLFSSSRLEAVMNRFPHRVARPCIGQRRHSAFTLVELLVVIG